MTGEAQLVSSSAARQTRQMNLVGDHLDLADCTETLLKLTE